MLLSLKVRRSQLFRNSRQRRGEEGGHDIHYHLISTRRSYTASSPSTPGQKRTAFTRRRLHSRRRRSPKQTGRAHQNDTVTETSDEVLPPRYDLPTGRGSATERAVRLPLRPEAVRMERLSPPAPPQPVDLGRARIVNLATHFSLARPLLRCFSSHISFSFLLLFLAFAIPLQIPDLRLREKLRDVTVRGGYPVGTKI